MEWLDSFWATYSTLVLSVGTNILLALSIYLTLACGLLTVANAAFMGIGAYSAALLTINGGIPFFFALMAGALLPALIALVIGRPTLRLSGVYLAMATLAFGEVVRIVILNAESLTGGALCLNGIPLLTGWFDVTLAALIGAALVTLLPELLRGLGHYRPLINGVILIVIILYSPKGIWELLQCAARRPRPSMTN